MVAEIFCPSYPYLHTHGSDEGVDCKCNSGYFNVVRTTAPAID